MAVVVTVVHVSVSVVRVISHTHTPSAEAYFIDHEGHVMSLLRAKVISKFQATACVAVVVSYLLT